ncbi:MAG TPA: hypothetical protein VMY39_00100 [Planctomycetota bacterium]|nr:hypothetical protein [Planctomycetota bacterium]
MTSINIKDAAGTSRAIGTTTIGANQYGTVVVISADGTPLSFDSVSGALEVIDIGHHEIHEGSSYAACSWTLLGNGDVYRIGVTTAAGSVYAHAVLSVTHNQITEVNVYEGSTWSDGSALVAMDRNRNTANTATATLAVGVTEGSDGTLMCSSKTGVRNTPAETRIADEWILKADTKYIVKITSDAATNIVSYEINWYEE